MVALSRQVVLPRLSYASIVVWISAREVFGHIYIVGQDPSDSKSSRSVTC